MRSFAIRLAALFAGGALVALFFASQGFLFYLRPGAGAPPPFSIFITATLIEWWGWAALGLPIFWLARRFPPTRTRHLALHLGAAIVISGGKLFLNALGRATLMDYDFSPQWRDFHTGLVTYTLLVGGAYAVGLWRRSVRLEALLAEARLRALAAQLQPHFLFNALNAIQSLLHDDPEAADRMISHLGDLLRGSLHAPDPLTLGDELALLAPYLEIQRARFADRLTVEIDVEPAALPVPVPRLLLQPLVENAIRHGIAPRVQPGTVTIRARCDGTVLAVEVEDDGVGLDPARADGVGLENTRQRLSELYGLRHRLELAPAPRGGTLVRLSLPVVS